MTAADRLVVGIVRDADKWSWHIASSWGGASGVAVTRRAAMAQAFDAAAKLCGEVPARHPVKERGEFPVWETK